MHSFSLKRSLTWDICCFCRISCVFYVVRGQSCMDITWLRNSVMHNGSWRVIARWRSFAEVRIWRGIGINLIAGYDPVTSGFIVWMPQWKLEFATKTSYREGDFPDMIKALAKAQFWVWSIDFGCEGSGAMRLIQGHSPRLHLDNGNIWFGDIIFPYSKYLYNLSIYRRKGYIGRIVWNKGPNPWWFNINSVQRQFR